MPDTGEPPNITAVVDVLLHKTWSEGSDTEGVGLMVIAKDCGIPAQVFAVGVTINVAVRGVEPEFVAKNEGILPVPLAAKPMLDVLFVQEYVVPMTAEPLNATTVVLSSLQIVGQEGAVTEGVGLTVIVNVCAEPVQPSAEGVTVIVETITVEPLLITEKATILPVPLAAKPMLVLSFVQL